MSVGIVDYEAGNLKSVETALLALGARIVVADRPEVLLKADRLIFPGVGDAAAAMRVLKARGLDQAIVQFVNSGRPVLGICLGSQVVLDASEENGAVCLGLVAGIARRFAPDSGLKIPHMGWNQVEPTADHYLFSAIPPGASFYFVHSYYPQPQDSAAVIGCTDYGVRFTAALSQGNLAAVQFHPEKSGRYGLQMLQNFLQCRA
ncbi:MAG: imidazole glycerol phosphate synthase subunit HisH [Spirochaetaceae bacterium]|nr:MAG: imidazole glycerol phosphate synthase subunit HisH [Spirochaetaceae bacterium]